jgi:hypothetical protein
MQFPIAIQISSLQDAAHEIAGKKAFRRLPTALQPPVKPGAEGASATV